MLMVSRLPVCGTAGCQPAPGKTVRGQEKQCNNALLAMLKSMPKMPEKRRAYS
jgi:hypothetical protein